jgi:Zn-dependent protease with chaperone function
MQDEGRGRAGGAPAASIFPDSRRAVQDLPVSRGAPVRGARAQVAIDSPARGAAIAFSRRGCSRRSHRVVRGARQGGEGPPGLVSDTVRKEKIRMRRTNALVITVFCAAMAVPAGAAAKEKWDGYLDFKKPTYLIVDGQRLEVNGRTRVSAGKVKKAMDIPLGWHLKAQGHRARDGTIVATKIQAEKNGSEFMESEVLQATNEEEKKYVQSKKVSDTGPNGEEKVIGNLIDSGPDVDRCRRIVERLLPPYIPKDKVRVYVVDNNAWNAMAMANFSVYVFKGLLPDLDDDELAIVLGHELTHATYEHSRRQAKGGVIQGIAGVAGTIIARQIGDEKGQIAAAGATALGVTTVGNVYSRDYEDQADRVGLRYVYEAGYDYKKAPGLWQKFARKYADSDPVSNFFFGNHSLSSARAAALQKEIENNYKDPSKDPPTHRIG